MTASEAAQLPRPDFLRWSLEQELIDLESARSADSHQAAAAMWRRVMATRADLDAAGAVEAPDVRPDEELVLEIAKAIEALPLRLLGPVFAAVDARR